MENPYAPPPVPQRLVDQTKLLARFCLVIPFAVFAFNALVLKKVGAILGPGVVLIILALQLALYAAAIVCGIVALRRVRRVGPKGVRAFAWTGIAVSALALAIVLAALS